MIPNCDARLDGSGGVRLPNLDTEEYATLIVEFTVSAEAVGLDTSLRAFPDVTVELEPIVPTDGELMPYLWTTQGDARRFREAVAADSTVETVRQIAEFEEESLFRIDWRASENTLHDWLRTRDSVLLEAQGRDGEWKFELRIESREALLKLQTYCEEHGITLDIVRIHELTASREEPYDVTVKQREVLLAALEMGYFEIPRNATLGEVAAEFGITTEAASERLRRGQANLVGNTLTIGRNDAS